MADNDPDILTVKDAAQALKRLREAAHLTQEQAALLTGVGTRDVSNWENAASMSATFVRIENYRTRLRDYIRDHQTTRS